jgi:F-type H+-transporting ATPase subunit a
LNLTPDTHIMLQLGPVGLNATIVWTWAVMALLTLISWRVTRNLSADVTMSRWQNTLESIVSYSSKSIAAVTGQDPKPYLPFVSTLFLFIATSNLLVPVPVYEPPTGSLSTTAALAVCVLFAVPIYAIRAEGVGAYLKHFIEPVPFILPLRIIEEFTRTLSLAVRLFGNVMSGSVIAAILLTIVPFFFPVLLHLLGMLTGVIQAYIFAMLALVYIASGQERHAAIKGGAQ